MKSIYLARLALIEWLYDLVMATATALEEAQDALGLTWTQDPKNTMGDGVDTYITIDCYFIDECWRHEFQGDYLIAGENLQHVIAHEIAHLSVWRHGKKHTALTEQIYQQIIAA